MMTAVYAPLKAPDHPVPSGDRQMARLLMAALDRAGAAPELACRLRTYDRGDAARQQRLDRIAARGADLLARRLARRPPRVWFTYHCHHKAPDGLGPRVAHLLNIPYVIAEASVAPARAEGPWREGYRQAVAAIARADVVIALTAKDARGLEPVVRPPARLVRLAPFTSTPSAPPPPPPSPPSGPPRLVVVAMMRAGAKAASFRMLAAALDGLRDRPWHLDIIGDGEARDEVEARFAPFEEERVTFHGRIDDAEARDAIVSGATAFVWPAVDEAYGMALLEAQALGVPIVAGDGHGLPDIVAHRQTGLLSPVGDAAAFRSNVASLLDRPARAAALGRAAAERIARHHGLDAAAARLAEYLRLAIAVHAARRQ